MRTNIRVNSTWQNKKTSLNKHGSPNAIFPSYSPANLLIIATEILNFSGLCLSRRASKTFKHVPSAVFNVTGYSPLSYPEPCAVRM
jgi:hypothetical protein